MKEFRTGLVVGKFNPLHLGHELLIRRAMAASERTIIISYSSPELPGCEPHKREQWLRARFPQAIVLVLDGERRPLPHNDADALLHRRFVGQICLDVLDTTVDAVFTSEDYGDGFAEELSRYFAARRGGQWQVRHMMVDQARMAVPISGTRVRADPHGLRDFLCDEVYASFVQTVCFLGGESSGKTTLTAAMAKRMDTVWAEEYGRELWVARNGDLTYDDMLTIATVHQHREDELRRQASRFLFCDTSALTTLFYCREMFGRAQPALEHAAERRYDHVFLCVPDFDFIQDGTRRDAAFSHRQHRWYMAELERRGIPYVLLEGPLQQRVAAVLARLA